VSTGSAGGDVDPRPATLVCFHAHPDDEALLTGGTIARAVAEGHRVVLVVATAGERGLTGTAVGRLGDQRLRELTASARVLGVARRRARSRSRTSTRPHAGWRRSCARRTPPC
jgi:LmbE family N-acetylglucosaminyl deacetylase